MNDELLDRRTNLYAEYGEPLSFAECPVCFGEHDDDIHAATLSVRQWFREEVTKSFRIAPVVA